VPGSMPIEAPADVGIRLAAGSRLVFNVHYHASVTGPEVDDAMGLALRWTTDVPAWVSSFGLVGAPGDGESTTGPFLIPAGRRATRRSSSGRCRRSAPRRCGSGRWGITCTRSAST
jgi:hypothetical protein